MRLLVSIVGMALLIAACGGDSGDESTDATVADATDTTAADASDTTTAPEPDDSGEATTTTTASDDGDDAGAAGGVSTGTVTVGGETYEFLDTGFPGIQCDPDAFGVAFLAGLQTEEATDGVVGSLVVGIPFPGEEETAGLMPEVQASVGDVEWIANPEHAELNGIPAGSSQVDAYEIDGNTITGTATFYERNSSFGDAADLIVETGTFEVTCAEG